MAAAYINLHHYYLAEQIINDGLELSDRVSQLYFRKAQCIGLSKNSTLEKLRFARTLIEKAIEMRPNEKIFSTANVNILKMLNLHDSE
jgi:isocitrate dehydrogenase